MINPATLPSRRSLLSRASTLSRFSKFSLALSRDDSTSSSFLRTFSSPPPAVLGTRVPVLSRRRGRRAGRGSRCRAHLALPLDRARLLANPPPSVATMEVALVALVWGKLFQLFQNLTRKEKRAQPLARTKCFKFQVDSAFLCCDSSRVTLQFASCHGAPPRALFT